MIVLNPSFRLLSIYKLQTLGLDFNFTLANFRVTQRGLINASPIDYGLPSIVDISTKKRKLLFSLSRANLPLTLWSSGSQGWRYFGGAYCGREHADQSGDSLFSASRSHPSCSTPARRATTVPFSRNTQENREERRNAIVCWNLSIRERPTPFCPTSNPVPPLCPISLGCRIIISIIPGPHDARINTTYPDGQRDRRRRYRGVRGGDEWSIERRRAPINFNSLRGSGGRGTGKISCFLDQFSCFCCLFFFLFTIGGWNE